ncbi:MAG: aminotransferase class I/II-fold pyridoxal phosphate-dependent enzyme, partial [Anaerolineae bacterium]|nr:aminotransferase class I/II-fold pyridoxal phosphate-dependent enzyme [Anaerolineae bacterium]
RRTLKATQGAADQLKEDLRSLGLKVVPNPMHFFLVEVGSAGAWQRRLAARGFLTRDSSSFGLPGHLRVGTRTPSDNRELVKAWRQVLESCG